MASTTQNLGLIKPASNENYNIDVFNENFQKIDNASAVESASLTLASGTGVSGSLVIQRSHKYRILRGVITLASPGTNIEVTTLQASDRPLISIYGACTGYGISVQSEVQIDSSNGKVTINCPNNGNTNSLKFAIPYFIG